MIFVYVIDFYAFPWYNKKVSIKEAYDKAYEFFKGAWFIVHIFRQLNESCSYQKDGKTFVIYYWDRTSFLIDGIILTAPGSKNPLEVVLNEIKNSFDNYVFAIDGQKHSFFFSPITIENETMKFSLVLSCTNDLQEATARVVLDEIAKRYEERVQVYLDGLS